MIELDIHRNILNLNNVCISFKYLILRMKYKQYWLSGNLFIYELFIWMKLILNYFTRQIILSLTTDRVDYSNKIIT